MSATFSHLLAEAVVSKIRNGMSIYDAQQIYGIPIFVLRKWLELYAEATEGGKR